MNELQRVFDYQGKPIRTVTLENGEPGFVAKDICTVLEIGNPTDAVKRLDEDEYTLVSIEGASNGLPVNAITESGLYSLTLSSRKPEAKQFKRWVTHEVLPNIRKRGMYATDQLLNDPDLAIKTFTALKEERERNKTLTAKAEQDKPKVLFAESVQASRTSILIGELAKIIKQNGVDMGQNRMFEWLRECGYLISRKGTDYNMPTQKAMDLGLFTIKETTVNHSDGHISISKTPKVTGKGQIYFVNKFKETTVTKGVLKA
ncbi:MAG: hypothetical protein H6Q71_1483 [Firmicutes bacterium]|nr:hypothetical protein [Bacillota bacterium]